MDSCVPLFQARSVGCRRVLAPPTLFDHSAEALEEPSRGILESFTQAMAMAHEIHTYPELRQQIHDDLRIQHPEWVQPNGESPICDSYEARLTDLIDALTQRRSNESIAAPHHGLEQGLDLIDNVVV